MTGTLGDIGGKVRRAKLVSQSMIIIGEVLSATDFKESRLYAKEFTHGFRQGQPEAGEHISG